MHRWIFITMRAMLAISLLSSPSAIFAQPQWIELSKSLNEANLHSFAQDSLNSDIIYVASDSRLYKTVDSGAHWSTVLTLKGSVHRILSVFTHPYKPDWLYVGTNQGVVISRDAGKKWSKTRRVGKAESVYAFYIESDGRLWLGTDRGLYLEDERAKSGFVLNPALASVAVLSICRAQTPGEVVLLSTTSVFYSNDNGRNWQRVHTFASAGEDEFAAVDIDEAWGVFRPYNIIYQNEWKRFFAASANGIWESVGGKSWQFFAKLPDSGEGGLWLTPVPHGLFAAGPHGVYEWSEGSSVYKQANTGLPSPEARQIAYIAYGEKLLLTTKSGLFVSYPGSDPTAVISREFKVIEQPDLDQILARFHAEPSVLEIQNAAIRYAEVHPDKIRKWRSRAAKKAWFPTLSFDHGLDEDENVDIDRGGTGDPDHFIYGPHERSRDWSVGLNWDLGEIIWNPDQTSIDVRSKLMVELRDDIVTQVTHLYYERRRLQIELLIQPPVALQSRIDKHLKLEELTAYLDGLTGGYLTSRLAQNLPPQSAL